MEKKSLKGEDKITTTKIIVAILIMIAIFIIFNQKDYDSAEISVEAAAEKVINYINEYFLDPGSVAYLTEVSDAGNVYKVSLKVEFEGNPFADFDSYVSKDGVFLFPEGYDMGKNPITGEPLEEAIKEQETEEQELDQPEDTENENLTDFIGCLEFAGVVIYGNKGCPACQQLTAEFGGFEAIESIYVECSEEQERCQKEMLVNYVPAVQINGELFEGWGSPENLAKETGCRL